MQNKNNDKDNEKLTPHSVFVLAVKLVAFAVLLYVTLNHFDAVLAVVKSFFALISPLLIGALIALVLNTPMLALERGFEWTAKKTGRRYNRRAGEIIALLVTFLAAFLIIYTVLYSIIPQIGDSLKAVYKKAVDNIPKLMEWMNSLDKYGIDTSEFTAWLADLDVNSLIKKFTDNASNILEAVVTGSFSAVSSIFSGASSIISGVVTPPLPSSVATTKVLTEGTKTMVIPERTPGRLNRIWQRMSDPPKKKYWAEDRGTPERC